MQSFLIPFFQGLLAVLSVSGVGRLVGRPLKVLNLPWYWQIVFSLLLGQAAVIVLVESLLLSGLANAHTLRVLAPLLIVAGIAGHLFCRKIRGGFTLSLFRQNQFIAAIFLAACLTNLIVSLAPSTKIDELFYHMLVPKRIVEDGGLQFYRLPMASAILPQMHYPIALSVAHAAGAPHAGNVLSWSFSVALMLFVVGFLYEALGSDRLALLFGAICSVGIYGAVWHTTGGSHALGELATVVALAGVLRPSILLPLVGARRYVLLLATAAVLAAATKISMWPLCSVITLLIVWKAAQQTGAWTAAPSLAALALLPWMVLHAPLMIWSYRVSGSFFGPVLANVFAPSPFPPHLLALLEEFRRINQTGLRPTLRFAAVELSPLFFLAVPWVLWTALRGSRTSRLVAYLFVFQCALIAWKLPHDFRFLGGLQYLMPIAAALTLAKPAESAPPVSNINWASFGDRLVRARIAIAMAFALPWLGLQMYYARPFASVVSGVMSRDQFIEHYVAFARDFKILDTALPKNAVIYCDNATLPNFYAPRPVLLTLLDLHSDKPIYRLTLKPKADSEPIDEKLLLSCGEMFYRNDYAVYETYRTPGKTAAIGSLKIQPCRIVPR